MSRHDGNERLKFLLYVGERFAFQDMKVWTVIVSVDLKNRCSPENSQTH